jgi:purine-nucleoside phosphorylase
VTENTIEGTREILRSVFSADLDCVVVLGSGLARIADSVDGAVTVKYADLPGFRGPTVEGHAGHLIAGRISGRTCALMQGRFHCYEGLSPAEVVFPIRVLLGLGRPFLLVTNAAGAVNEDFNTGEIMLIKDHINLTGLNPLTGPNDPGLGPRFPDMGEAYSRVLLNTAVAAAAAAEIPIKEGVYAGVAGPSYETPAEIAMLRKLGADAVGMSTVHEVIAARHMGRDVLGISIISNAWAAHSKSMLTHSEVQAEAGKAAGSALKLLPEILKRTDFGQRD